MQCVYVYTCMCVHVQVLYSTCVCISLVYLHHSRRHITLFLLLFLSVLPPLSLSWGDEKRGMKDKGKAENYREGEREKGREGGRERRKEREEEEGDQCKE